MTTTSFVVISSKYMTGDSRSTSDFTFSIGQSLEISAMAVKSISIPNVQNNITKHNNKLTIVSEDAIKVIFVPIGHYDITMFMTALELAIGSGTTITQNPTTKKIQIQSSNAFKVSINTINSPLARVIGFGGSQDNNYYPHNVSNDLICPFLPQLSGLKNYYLCSRVLAQGFNGIFQSGDQLPLVMNIPIIVGCGHVQHYEAQDIRLNLKKYNRPQNINMMDITIYDEDLNIVDLQGADVEIVLKIWTNDSKIPE